MKKVTLQDIADSIGVSRISVWKVFSGRDGVSDELRNRIIAKATELNYNFPKDFELPEQQKAKRHYNISVTVSHPETSLFWMTVIHEIAKELSKRNVNLIYTYLPSKITEDYTLPSQLSDGSVDGIIVLNVYDERLVRLLSNLSLPKVYMDTSGKVEFDELNGDLVLCSSKSGIAKITEQMIVQGRTEIGFVGDIHYSKTNQERYEGYLEAMRKYNLPIRKELSYTGTIRMNNYEKDIVSFLDSLHKMPQGFVCTNDQIACFLWNELAIRGYQVPKDIYLSGFGGYQDCTLTKGLTTVQVFSQDLGLRLATQALYKIKNPSLRHEIIYVSSETYFRNSTKQIENLE